jgi:hypothetical protein
MYPNNRRAQDLLASALAELTSAELAAAPYLTASALERAAIANVYANLAALERAAIANVYANLAGLALVSPELFDIPSHEHTWIDPTFPGFPRFCACGAKDHGAPHEFVESGPGQEPVTVKGQIVCGDCLQPKRAHR